MLSIQHFELWLLCLWLHKQPLGNDVCHYFPIELSHQHIFKRQFCSTSPTYIQSICWKKIRINITYRHAHTPTYRHVSFPKHNSVQYVMNMHWTGACFYITVSIKLMLPFKWGWLTQQPYTRYSVLQTVLNYQYVDAMPRPKAIIDRVIRGCLTDRVTAG